MPDDTFSKQDRQIVVVGTRGSDLALTQTRWVVAQLVRHYPDVEVQIKSVRTQGDILRTASLAQIGGTGVFVKEIESALVAGEIDLAVHSLKDLPVRQPTGVIIGAVCPREDPRDVLISTRAGGLDGLPEGAVVGTGSLRRRAQLLVHRPDLEVRDIRGNVGTRLRKLRDEEYDAIVLAAAGLKRLGYTVEGQYLPLDIMLPAVGQGALAVEIRDGDPVTAPFMEAVDDPTTRAAVLAETTFLAAFGSGCAVPIGAYAEISGETMLMKGMVASLDGERHLRDELSGPARDPEALGLSLARVLLARGAGEIINEVIGGS